MFCGEAAIIINRNKVCNSCNALESSPDQSLVPEKVGDCCARVCFSVFGVPRICRTSFLQMCPLSQYGRCRIKYMCVGVCGCVWVCVGVCVYFFLVCLCLVAHIETICLETLIPFRLHFLFKASFMFLVCMICHQAFPCVFNDDHSYCEMSSCDSLSVALLFICHPSRLICHCSIQILHPLTRNYGKPWLTNSKVSTPCKPAECPDLPVSSPEVS